MLSQSESATAVKSIYVIQDVRTGKFLAADFELTAFSAAMQVTDSNDATWLDARIDEDAVILRAIHPPFRALDLSMEGVQ